MRNYVALIMDIEKSRAYVTEDRIELQKYMSYCIDMLNELLNRYPSLFACNVIKTGKNKSRYWCG